jgi:hypothetical protein
VRCTVHTILCTSKVSSRLHCEWGGKLTRVETMFLRRPKPMNLCKCPASLPGLPRSPVPESEKKVPHLLLSSVTPHPDTGLPSGHTSPVVRYSDLGVGGRESYRPQKQPSNFRHRFCNSQVLRLVPRSFPRPTTLRPASSLATRGGTCEQTRSASRGPLATVRWGSRLEDVTIQKQATDSFPSSATIELAQGSHRRWSFHEELLRTSKGPSSMCLARCPDEIVIKPLHVVNSRLLSAVEVPALASTCANQSRRGAKE